MFDANRVYFGRARSIVLDLALRDQAELVDFLANIGLSGPTLIPQAEALCQKVMIQAKKDVEHAKSRLRELASSRISNEDLRDDVVSLLFQWYVKGRPSMLSPKGSKP